MANLIIRKIKGISMQRIFHIVTILVSTGFLLSCATTQKTPEHYDYFQQSHPQVYQLLTMMPLEDGASRDSVNTALLTLGPDKLSEITNLVLPAGIGNDAKPRYALGDLSHFVTQPGLESERQMYESVLLSALSDAEDEEVKAFFLRQLEQVGSSRAIGPVSRYLRDPKLYAPATKTLLSIDSLESAELFIKSLNNAPDERIPTLLNAIGETGHAPDAEAIAEYAGSDDDDIRLAALHALASLGNPGSAEILAQASLDAGPYNRGQVHGFYLDYASVLADSGEAALSESIYRGLISDRTGDENSHIRIHAATGLVRLLGDRANEDLITLFSQDNKQVRVEILRLAEGIQGDHITRAWIDQMEAADAQRQAEIIDMLGRRGESEAFQPVLEQLNSNEAEVRKSAVESVVKLNASQAVSELLSVLERTDSSEERQLVKATLLRIPNDDILPKIDYRLPQMPAAAQVELLDIFSQRRAVRYKKTILTFTDAEDPQVRAAALSALRNIGGAEDISTAMNVVISADNGTVRSVAQRTAVSLAELLGSDQSRVDAITSRYESVSPQQKVYVLQTLGQIGSDGALSVLRNEVNSDNETVRDGAIRVLANWQSADALDPLMNIADQSTTLTHQVLSIQGALRLLNQSGMSDAERIDRYQTLMQLAPRAQEKRMVIGGLSNVNDPEALEIIVGYLSDPDVERDAATAILNYAAKTDDRQGEIVASQVSHALLTRIVSEQTASQVREIVKERTMNMPPEGYVALFNGEDLTGWQGIIADGNPAKKRQMNHKEIAKATHESNELMRQQWSVQDGVLIFGGEGFHSIRTVEKYRNFDMLVDWKIEPGGDSGLYLRGVPQVQIWDAGENPVGSGGLYNNQNHPSEPSVVADNPVGEWNTFRIRMVEDEVTVWLNGTTVVDNVPLENYWERGRPLPEEGPIWLQAHDSKLYFKNIFIKELPGEERLFSGPLFNGEDLTGWEQIEGEEGAWGVENGLLFTEGAGGGWLSTDRTFDNFKLSLEFRVPEGGNSGVFLRTPRHGNPAYAGMEAQVLDDYAEKYETLQPWQYTGSIYAVVAPSKRVTKPAGEWNTYEILCNGPMVKIWLNGELVNDTNLIHHMDKADSHPGIKRRSGYIGLQNHSTRVDYRNIVIKELK
ncbi:MAG: DUF1080 domain-containing protein [Candidatus Marinimicrobia bacterium]|nr:DUF1080 domain-containing protein [Candidatus Neomarinimicrobiota bacterium]